MEQFLINALLAGIGLSLITGPVGCFVVWRRMSYFGDSLSHAALLGISLGLLLGIDLTISSLIITGIFALLLVNMRSKQSDDTILGILAHSGLAVAIVILSFMKTVRVDLMSYLFGDVLAVSTDDLLIVFILVLLTLTWLVFVWKKLLLITINKDLAIVEGINIKLIETQFVLILSIIVALSIKIVGILLITALLIIPPATARTISKSPKQMAYLSILFGVLSVITGILVSLFIDIPTGPSIVVSALGFFILVSTFFKRYNVV